MLYDCLYISSPLFILEEVKAVDMLIKMKLHDIRIFSQWIRIKKNLIHFIYITVDTLLDHFTEIVYFSYLQC